MKFSETKEAKELESLRKMRLMVLGTLQRANSAHIPDKWQRINKDVFKALLSKNYHGKYADVLATTIYENQDLMTKIPFVLIDGGDSDSRTAAGCAILFRLISYNRRGLVMSCGELVRKTQMMDYSAEINRNELTDDLKNYGALFITEFNRSLFKGHLQEAQFMDEILGSRSDNSMPTIISYTNPFDKAEIIRDADCGQCLAKLSVLETVDPNPSENYLRIRVQKT